LKRPLVLPLRPRQLSLFWCFESCYKNSIMNYRDFQERKRFERVLYSGWSILAVFLLLILSVTGVVKLWARERAINAEIDELQSKIFEVRTAKESGLKKLGELDAPEGIDAEARGRFNLKKDGEELVVFMDNRNLVEEKGGFWASAGASRARVWQNIKNWLGL